MRSHLGLENASLVRQLIASAARAVVMPNAGQKSHPPLSGNPCQVGVVTDASRQSSEHGKSFDSRCVDADRHGQTASKAVQVLGPTMPSGTNPRDR